MPALCWIPFLEILFIYMMYQIYLDGEHLSAVML